MIVILGRSVEGRKIEAHTSLHGGGGALTLIFGGFHGDEPKSVSLANKLLEELTSSQPAKHRGRWVIVPMVNPDGCACRRRRNAHRVDINRNFPTQNWESGSSRSRMFGGTKPFSEPETKAVIAAVTRFRPVRIITIHSIGRERYCNNYDGPGRKVASRLARANRYPVTATIGYPTPGSLGAWAGVEKGIPTVTLELPSLHSSKRCWEDNRAGLLDVVSSAVRV